VEIDGAPLGTSPLVRTDVATGLHALRLSLEGHAAAFRAAERSALFLSIGTSAIVQPAASLPLVAKNAGAFLVEINTEPTVISSYADLFLQGKSGEILPRLIEECGIG